MTPAMPTLSLDVCLPAKDVLALQEYAEQLASYYRERSAKTADDMKVSGGEICRYSGDVGAAIRAQP